MRPPDPMLDRHSIFDSITSALVPIHRDGHKFVVLAAIVTLVLFWIWDPLGWLATLGTIFVAYFFRDPERATPTRDGLVVAPADGRIVAIRRKVPPRDLALPEASVTCVSIFLSIFNVHVTRAPVSGRIVRNVYIPGLFLNAQLDKASEDNEREAMTIKMATGEDVGIVRIAGLIARRIVTTVRENETVDAGKRTGLIRFGSRVDIYLPGERGLLVAEGQTVIAGETVLVDLRSEESGREVRVA